MYFDNTKPTKSFIYVQYNDPKPIEVSSPSSSSSASSSPVIQQDEQFKKRKRQHAVGYACDKCRERRVRCDRDKPCCGQCKDKYLCQYSNETRIDNTTMRQRLNDLENQIGWLTSIVTNMEEDYRSTIPRLQPHVQPQVVQQQPSLLTCLAISPVLSRSNKEGPTVCDWAIQTGWPVIENADGMRSIFTTIKKFEDLSKVLKETIQPTLPQKRPSIALEPEAKEHTFTLFESLNRYNSHHATGTNISEIHLETDIKTRLIQQHHKCGFPTLVSPSRFQSHYRQGQLKSLVLSSVFSHSVPHCCIYHPHLTQIQGYKELGEKFYNHSHDLLGIDEPANLSNIHQRTLLITYDLDMGRVRRAFLHIGIAIRMCFMLNLHCPEGYVSCKTAFEREQSKRIFWTVWFYDNMVSHLFHDQLSTIKLSQIKIELPTPLPEFDSIELDQTIFSISLIQIRKIAGSISETSRKVKPRALITQFREQLVDFYNSLPKDLQFGKPDQTSFPQNTSIWGRRNYFCILLDYCLCWITIYRGLLPPAHLQGERSLTQDEQEAILHVSQAAVAIIQLFQNWFEASLDSDEGFDCFFRPYLYHFMSAKHVFTANVSQFGRTPALIYVSRAYLVLMLQLYQTTPTKNSVDESALEKSLVEFLNRHQISTKEVVYQSMIDEALVDDTNADSGWSIFRLVDP